MWDHEKSRILIIAPEHKKSYVTGIVDKLQTFEWTIDTYLVPNEYFSTWDAKVRLPDSLKIRWSIVYTIVWFNDQVFNNQIKNKQNRLLSSSDICGFTKAILACVQQYEPKYSNLIATSWVHHSRSDKDIWFTKKNDENVQITYREPNLAKAYIQELKLIYGVDKIITIDNHASVGEDINLGILHFLEKIVQEIRTTTSTQLDNFTMLSPDANGSKKVKNYAKLLGIYHTSLAEKERNPAKKHSDNIEKLTIHNKEHIPNQHVIIYDDMIDSGWSMINLLETIHLLWPKSVTIFTTHGIFNNPAYERLINARKNGFLHSLYITDTVTHQEEDLHQKKYNFINIKDTTPIVAMTIDEQIHGISITHRYKIAV